METVAIINACNTIEANGTPLEIKVLTSYIQYKRDKVEWNSILLKNNCNNLNKAKMINVSSARSNEVNIVYGSFKMNQPHENSNNESSRTYCIYIIHF